MNYPKSQGRNNRTTTPCDLTGFPAIQFCLDTQSDEDPTWQHLIGEFNKPSAAWMIEAKQGANDIQVHPRGKFNRLQTKPIQLLFTLIYNQKTTIYTIYIIYLQKSEFWRTD